MTEGASGWRCTLEWLTCRPRWRWEAAPNSQGVWCAAAIAPRYEGGRVPDGRDVYNCTDGAVGISKVRRMSPVESTHKPTIKRKSPWLASPPDQRLSNRSSLRTVSPDIFNIASGDGISSELSWSITEYRVAGTRGRIMST